MNIDSRVKKLLEVHCRNFKTDISDVVCRAMEFYTCECLNRQSISKHWNNMLELFELEKIYGGKQTDR